MWSASEVSNQSLWSDNRYILKFLLHYITHISDHKQDPDYQANIAAWTPVPKTQTARLTLLHEYLYHAVTSVKKREPKQSRSPTNRLSSSEQPDWIDTSEDEDRIRMREVNKYNERGRGRETNRDRNWHKGTQWEGERVRLWERKTTYNQLASTWLYSNKL